MIIMGIGLSSSIYTPLSSHIINPDGIKPVYDPATKEKEYPPEVYDNVPKLYRALIIIWTCLSVVGILFTFTAPE